MQLLTVYQTESLQELPEVQKNIKIIEKILNISIIENKEHIPAVVGELAGIGLELVTSKYLSGALNIIALHQIAKASWNIIRNIHKEKKTCDIEKEFAKSLALSRVLKLYKKWHKEMYTKLKPESISILEPVLIVPESKKFHDLCYSKDFDDEGRELGYFTSISLPKSKKEHVTYYFIFRIDGRLIASWSTG